MKCYKIRNDLFEGVNNINKLEDFKLNDSKYFPLIFYHH